MIRTTWSGTGAVGRLLAMARREYSWPLRASPVLHCIAGALIAWPAAGLVHEVLVLLMAALLPLLTASWPAEQLVRLLPMSRVYTQAFLDMASGLDPAGLAIRAPIGNWLGALLPALFVAPGDVAMTSLVSAVIEPGSALPARLIVSAFADVAVLTAGLGMTWRALVVRPGSGRSRVWLAVGLVVQLVVVARALRAPITAQMLEAIGALPFLYHELLHLPTESYDRGLAFLTSIQPLLTLAGLLSLYVLAESLVLAGHALGRRCWPAPTPDAAEEAARSETAAPLAQRFRLALSASGRPTLAIVVVAGSVVTPVGDLLTVDTLFLHAQAPSEVVRVWRPVRSMVVEATATFDRPRRSAAPAPVPMTARVAGRDGQFAYYVEGKTTTLRAMGYNVQYASLPPAERAARYDRDFKLLAEIGVNLLTGWRQGEFDGVLLDAAARAGLGVAMPYELDPATLYGDLAFRQAITADVLAWVERYRRHPAVRMWAIGNEVLMHIKDAGRARLFAEFYRDLVQSVLGADSDHPVVYRDAEDVYLPPLQEAMARRGGPPPGFVYGMNFYTFRLKEVLGNWSKKRFDVPVMISEFAPAGFGRRERPEGFRRMWGVIQTHQNFVIGGSPYVWSTDGPEPVDRLFGLVDGEGRPVDDSVDAFRELYRGAAGQDWASATTVVPPVVGLTEAEAVQALANAGVRVGRAERVLAREARALGLKGRLMPGRVVAQEPAEGGVRITVVAPGPVGGAGRVSP